MESKKIVVVAIVATIIMQAAMSSSASFVVDDKDSIKLVTDGRAQADQDMNNGCPRKMMIKGGVFKEEEMVCPKILMKCKHDSDCLLDCVCLEDIGYCGVS